MKKGENKIGKGIKEFRTLAGLTQKELADKCGLATVTIRQYENGSREPKIETLKKIADILSTSIVNITGLKLINLNIGSEKDKTFFEDQDKLADCFEEYIDLTDMAKLLNCYDSLNSLGQKEALKRVDELTLIEKYTKKDPENDNQDLLKNM